MSYQLKCEFEDPWLQGANSKGTHLQGLLGQLKNELSIKVWIWGPWLQGANSKGTHLQGFLGQLKMSYQSQPS
jgi:hypothetical protein